MGRCLLGLVLGFFCFQNAIAKEISLSSMYLGSREGDPASLIENVSTVHGDYSEIEVDLTVPAPDSLILSRFYSSRDSIQTANFGGWRFSPHCFLSIQKDPKGKTYKTGEGTFEYTYVFVGTPEGNILPYTGWHNPSSKKPVVFKIDAEGETLGLANTARGNISAWTKIKNNELSFNTQNNSFELTLASGGKRFYVKHPSLDLYLLKLEVLPSGNKIFYEFDDQGKLNLIKETNAAEKKVLAWIKIEYGDGVHVDTSDGRTVDYHFQQDGSGQTLLSQVIRSDKPSVSYQYKVVGERALLTRTDLPEGRFVSVDYDSRQENKVRSVTTPASVNGTTATQFSYGQDSDGSGWTEVNGPGNRKTLYRFDEDLQLTHIEQYLSGSLYRVHRKYWGKGQNASNLIATSVQDGQGAVFCYKSYTYDDRDTGNIVEEREYGNLTGAKPGPIACDEEGIPDESQESHVKTYSYHTVDDVDVVNQTDAKGTGLRLAYKRGTNLLVRKAILEKENRKKRWFYDYNEDGALIQVIVDDGNDVEAKYFYNATERHITNISPKKELPNIGAAEIVEEKCVAIEGKSEILLKRTVNHFDSQGNLDSQDIYDAKGAHQYSIRKVYENGLLTLETDPLGNETHYSYDANHNLILEEHPDTGVSLEHGYDLKNRLIYTAEKDSSGSSFAVHVSYDAAGNKISETDRFDNETLYTPDDLGRILSVTYPEIRDGKTSSIRPAYTYSHDLFDNPISITDPKGNVTQKTYNVRSKPTSIHHPDGTQELFKYDPEGSLHRYSGRDGLIKVFEYDYLGRVAHIEYYQRGSTGQRDGFKRDYFWYSAFRLLSKSDDQGPALYTYDHAGRLLTITESRKRSQCWYSTGISKIEDGDKVEFVYDALGRTRAVKKWKDSKAFTLQVKEYDLLNRVLEERIENEKGSALVKSRYVYNDKGQLSQVIGYPNNQESVLAQYGYDGFSRLSTIRDALNQETQVIYDDRYVNELGQRVLKRTHIDPLGNQKEEIFDISNNLVKTCMKDKSGQLLAQSELIYDCYGNKIFENNTVLSAGKPLRTYATEWSYDFGGQLRTITQAIGTPDERMTTLTYNPYGDLSQKLQPGSKEPITYRYNDQGQLTSLSYQEAKNAKVSHQLSYDDKGHVKEVNLGSTYTLKLEIDTDGQLLSETVKDEWASYTVSCTRNGEGLIDRIKLPDGSSIEYSYDGPFVKNASRFTKEKKELYSYRIASRDLMGHSLEEILIGYTGGRKQSWDLAARRTGIVTGHFQDKVAEYDSLQNIRKRETVLDDETSTTEYEYNALSQLISEKGEIEHRYSYDSLGNRLQRDGSNYTVNDLNQTLEAEGTSYTFDLNGNLATKTVGGKTWVYQNNPLGQLISVTDPDQNVVTCTYDLSGKRLTKRVESKGKKVKVFRYFYLGQTELGCLDEKRVIVELKVPSDPNRPEAAPSVAIEFKKEIYAPVYDLQGNIVCLVDPQKRKIVESYRYSAFGEEEIINERGRVVADSAVGNPWRYRGKRVDKETGLIYFGQRYYDPRTGRWISPDPAGNIDGPNLYTFAHNNPMTYVDYFGLASEMNENQGKEFLGYFYGEYEPYCHCEQHRTCKRGGDIGSALGGISHGVVDFIVGSAHDLQTMLVYMGSGEMGMTLNERVLMIDAVERSQTSQMKAVEGWMMDMLSIDESDAVYQSFRSKTTMGLEVGSLIVGGYGAVKGVMSFSKLARMPAQVSRMAAKNLHSAESLYQGRLLHSHLKQVQKYGTQGYKKLANGRIRYYGDIDLSKTKGEMLGRRLVREWNPQTGLKRTWHETIDQSGNIRIVRPEVNDGSKIHYLFDSNGIFDGTR